MNLRKYYVATLAISIIIFHTATTAQTGEVSKNLPNFQKINDHLYRGGQPKDAGFAELKRMGVVTVIDLRDNDDRALREKTLVESAGMRFMNIPLGNWNRPDLKDVDNIIAQINAVQNQPVFVHCKRGSDRTGTLIAVYRMTADGWTAKEAGEEAEKFGIGWWQFGMRDFINDYYRDHIPKK